jgi:hypothetical protein
VQPSYHLLEIDRVIGVEGFSRMTGRHGMLLLMLVLMLVLLVLMLSWGCWGCHWVDYRLVSL